MGAGQQPGVWAGMGEKGKKKESLQSLMEGRRNRIGTIYILCPGPIPHPQIGGL